MSLRRGGEGGQREHEGVERVESSAPHDGGPGVACPPRDNEDGRDPTEVDDGLRRVKRGEERERRQGESEVSEGWLGGENAERSS